MAGGQIAKQERTVVAKDRQRASFKGEDLWKHLLCCLRDEGIPEHTMTK
jgi:hypothetical protein